MTSTALVNSLTGIAVFVALTMTSEFDLVRLIGHRHFFSDVGWKGRRKPRTARTYRTRKTNDPRHETSFDSKGVDRPVSRVSDCARRFLALWTEIHSGYAGHPAYSGGTVMACTIFPGADGYL
jgi:hypothetical protein